MTRKLFVTISCSYLLGILSLPAQDLPPRFSFEPIMAFPGESLTVRASGFPEGSTLAIIQLADEKITETTLGVVPIVSGELVAVLPLPLTLSGGNYLVRIGDNSRKSAINFTGTLTVLSDSSPWFVFQPTTTAPGTVVQIAGSGFGPASRWVTIALLDSIGTGRILGVAPLEGGRFFKSVQIPQDLPARRGYRLVVRDLQTFGRNLSGPLTLAFSELEPKIGVGNYPVGVAVNPLTNRIYVPNAADNTLSVIDGETHSQIDTVAVGELPCAVAVDPQRDRIYVANVNDHSLSVVDGATHVVLASIPVGQFPCAVAVLPSPGRVYVGNYIGDDVSVIDGDTNSLVTSLPLSGSPFGMAADPAANRVYVATGGADLLTVINGASDQVVDEIPVGAAPDAVAVNPLTGRVYVANYFGQTVSVVDGDTHTVLSVVPVGKEPSGVTVNPTSGRVFVGNYASNTVTVLDGDTLAVLATLPVGTTPDGMASNPLSNRIYAVNSNSNNVTVIQDPVP